VFNRWGNTVWESDKTGYINNWKGTDMNNDPLPDGTYYYILTINDGHNTKYEGYVTIDR
jgi:gliding motility-associated-like protein